MWNDESEFYQYMLQEGMSRNSCNLYKSMLTFISQAHPLGNDLTETAIDHIISSERERQKLPSRTVYTTEKDLGNFRSVLRKYALYLKSDFKKRNEEAIFSEINKTERLFVDKAEQIVLSGRNEAYHAVNQSIIRTYWLLGQHIVAQELTGKEHAQSYGQYLMTLLEQHLTAKYGATYSRRNLYYYAQFYQLFPDYEIVNARVHNLTWTHFRALLRVTDDTARNWYLREADTQVWSSRTLERNISSQYYERLLLSQKKEPVIAEMKQLTAAYDADKLEFIKNPVVAEFLGLSTNPSFTETELESAIISNIQQFLMEMGKGYAFVARQQHIRTTEADYFIDLVFYNYILKCFVLVDLKTTKISYQDVGQMDMYLQLYDTYRKGENDNPTIGIVLCSDTNEDVARFSTLAKNKQLFAAKYKLYLPSEEELRKEIERQKEIYQIQEAEQSKHITIL